MSPQRMGGRAFWASGGGVEGRCGPIGLADAFALLRFLSDEAATRVTGDAAAVEFCAELALELGCALARAVAWRRCADQTLRVSGETAAVWLRKA